MEIANVAGVKVWDFIAPDERVGRQFIEHGRLGYGLQFPHPVGDGAQLCEWFAFH